MAVTAAPGDFTAETRLPSDYLPLLRWMIFTGVCVFGFVLAWHFGLIRMMLNGDKTYISVIILSLYAVASIHCLVRTVTISRELSKAMRIKALVSTGQHGDDDPHDPAGEVGPAEQVPEPAHDDRARPDDATVRADARGDQPRDRPAHDHNDRAREHEWTHAREQHDPADEDERDRVGQQMPEAGVQERHGQDADQATDVTRA